MFKIVKSIEVLLWQYGKSNVAHDKHSGVLFCAVLCCAVLFRSVLCHAVPCRAMLCCEENLY